MLPSHKLARERMVEVDLRGRGIGDARVLEAFRRIPREAFVPAELGERAYDDAPLPIGSGQTISQPYIVAVTAEALALEGWERVLEVGAGSGYAAAILSQLARQVFTIDRVADLADSARERLARLGIVNVEVGCGDGSLGWSAHAPYDAIAVAAGGPRIPPALVAQLAIGGRLVIPVGSTMVTQALVRVTRVADTQFHEERLGEVRFVPLIGREGWRDDGGAVAVSTVSTADTPRAPQ